jgi:hypothetical protein
MLGKRDGCSCAGWLATSSTVLCKKHVGRGKNASVGGRWTLGKVIERTVVFTGLHSHREPIRYNRHSVPFVIPFSGSRHVQHGRVIDVVVDYGPGMDRSLTGRTERHTRGGGSYESSPSPNNQSHPRSACLIILIFRQRTRIVRIHCLPSKETSEILTWTMRARPCLRHGLRRPHHPQIMMQRGRDAKPEA